MRLNSFQSLNRKCFVQLSGLGALLIVMSCGTKTSFSVATAPAKAPAAKPVQSVSPAVNADKPSLSKSSAEDVAQKTIVETPKILQECKVDLKALFGGFSLKGGSSLPFTESFSEYPNSKLRLQFEAGTRLSYSEGKLSAAKGVPKEGTESVSVSIADIPECNTKVDVKLVPDNAFVVGSTLERGVKGKLYVVPKGQGALPDYTQLKPVADVFMATIDIPTRSFTEGFPNVPELKEWFSIDFRGFLLISTPGDYQFRIVSDDGSKLFLNNQLVIDNDGTHGTKSVSSSVMHFENGNVPLNLPYFQGPGSEIALQLFYKGPGVSEWTIVPQSMLRIE